MDLDNPSYFCVSNGKKRMEHGESSTSSTSECSLTRQVTPPRRKDIYRDRRNYLRSVSSNSADSNHELLIMGEPRLNDIAPDLAFKHPSARSNSLKNQKVDLRSDLTYSPLATSEEQADALSEDEVFLGEDSARYYNFKAIKRTGQRRHSIGTFVGADQTNCVASTSRSFKEDFPQRDTENVAEIITVEDDLSLRQASYPRKRCNRYNRGTISRQANMDDILIVSLKGSSPASLWVDYFSNYFQQISKQANRKPFRIHSIGAEELIGNSEKNYGEIVAKSANVKLQLIVVCPSFLEFIADHPDECAILGKLLLADRTLALLLGVTDNDLTDVHKKVLPTYYFWQRQSVGQDQDENFTKEFLGQAVGILSRIWKQQSSVVSQDKSCFSVTPKKIRQGQNSVFVLLTYPLQKDDIVKISVEKNGKLFEMKTVKRRNPYIMKFTVPENLTEVTAIVNVLVEKNGSIIGSRPIKCESKLKELEQILRSTNNPVEFMCQSLGFSLAEREYLDNWLTQGFQGNVPLHFNLLSNHETPYAAVTQVHKQSHEEFPTLLHFAAKFGLEKLAIHLLDCPGANVAYEIRNIYDMTPMEIAEANGYSQLAEMLGGYINITEFTNMYAKLKQLSLSPKTPELDEDGYLTPKHFEDFYKLCPAPRPVFSESSPAITPSSDWSASGGYMEMNTPAAIPKYGSAGCNKDPPFEFQPKLQQTEPYGLVPKNTKHKEKVEVVEDKVLKELAEIINDFKNNVHSISQVEKLVEEWKNRNDVQKSFREKQQQLMEMRLRYEQIQTEMKTVMKKPTPFERIKNMFFKPQRQYKGEITSPITVTGPNTIITQAQVLRPISSLSTSSSGSSGRMSTISGSSLGDSGTHSDNEERKLMLGSNSEDDFRNTLNKVIMELNYTMLPTPKPVKVFPTRHTFETIEEKPLTRPEPPNEEYYIQFPPSGLPVPGMEMSEQDHPPTKEYVNVAATANSTNSHEYMNYKLPMSR